jgi:hypothetical protein
MGFGKLFEGTAGALGTLLASHLLGLPLLKAVEK